MKLVLSEINGFSCPDGEISIFSKKNGKPFYFKRKTAQDETLFNMPAGIYFTKNNLTKLQNPLIYKTPELPMPERNVKQPEKLTIIVETNPNKCSVAKQKGIIIIDPSLLNEPRPFLDFILFHEIGHYDYTTEWKCDLFSAVQMLEKGYNPSQCLSAQYISLSEHQTERKQRLFEFLKDTTAK